MFPKTQLSSFVFLSVVSAYTWPNPLLDELESQVYDLFGYNANGFPGFQTGINPCKLDFFNTGLANSNRSNAADWIRTVCGSCHLRYSTVADRHPLQAYHDMATYNVTDGTGGLDGSIQYEQDRAEVGSLRSSPTYDPTYCMRSERGRWIQ